MQLLKRFSLLRRIAKAQERTAEALERIATVAEDTWARKHAPRRMGEVSELDVDWLNEQYEKQQKARDQGFTLEPDE